MYFFSINGNPIVRDSDDARNRRLANFDFTELSSFFDYLRTDTLGHFIVSEKTGLYYIDVEKLANNNLSILEESTSMSPPMEMNNHIVQYLNFEINLDTFDEFGLGKLQMTTH